MLDDSKAVDDTLNGIAALPAKLFTLRQFIHNRSFILTIGPQKSFRLRRLGNGVP